MRNGVPTRCQRLDWWAPQGILSVACIILVLSLTITDLDEASASFREGILTSTDLDYLDDVDDEALSAVTVASITFRCVTDSTGLNVSPPQMPSAIPSLAHERGPPLCTYRFAFGPQLALDHLTPRHPPWLPPTDSSCRTSAHCDRSPEAVPEFYSVNGQQTYLLVFKLAHCPDKNPDDKG